jgi:hypothetical protein
MRTPTSPGGPGEIPATPGDGVPRTRSTVVPSEVFAAQFLFTRAPSPPGWWSQASRPS